MRKLANVEIDYKCICGYEITVIIDDYYLVEVPKCADCKQIMREVSRTQPDRYEVEQDQNERDRR